ncbi:SRPBCC family protein [Nonomuraea bangladeshensis]|uniref:SRPBCC family protein n=1 Tax=Nonomuraea bangladeshensis TaxID=404385 RepID=UPI003C2E20BB
MTATSAERRHPSDAGTSPMRREGSVSRVIAADPLRLYHWVSDITRTPEWSPETRRCTWAGNVRTARAGARFAGVNRFALLRWTRQCEVVVAEPGRELSFRTLPDAKVADSTVWTFRLEPAPGGTRVTHAYEMVAHLTPGQERLATLLIPPHRDRRPDMARSLDRLADAVEGRTHARQARLGQTHTAEGPIDLTGVYALHRALRRDLDLLARAVPATPPGDAEAWAALARRWHVCAAVLRHRTAGADAVLPLLLERADAAGDPAAREAAERARTERDHLTPMIDACTAAFRALTSEPIPGAGIRERLAAEVAGLRDALVELLAYEESTVLPLVQRHLSVASWQEAEQAAWQAFDRFGPAVTLPRPALPWLALPSLVLPWLAQDTPRDELGHVLAHTGGPIARAALNRNGSGRAVPAPGGGSMTGAALTWGGGPIARVLLALARRRFEREHQVAFRWL